MVEDKYIGLALAVSGTVAIGSSFIITKKVIAAVPLQSDDLITHPRLRHPGPQRSRRQRAYIFSSV
jgi:hypothetical protein